jgi:hypothetical protein
LFIFLSLPKRRDKGVAKETDMLVLNFPLVTNIRDNEKLGPVPES